MGESKAVASARGWLPAELTSFVGRRRELSATRRLLSSSRLLTLTGPGGVGKTRLALRMATEVRRTFADGVWFVELAALRDPELLAGTLAEALELSQVSANPVHDLAEYLEDKHLLLVMDNCEHLAEACAVLVSKLLATAPRLQIVATSRHVLGVEGEQVLSVPPLSTPPAQAPAADADQYEAMVLFTDRVRSVLPDFAVDDTNRAQVTELCRQLDGVPLALELAAMWMRALSLQQILDRLDDRFRLLAGGNPTAPPRQQALEAAIDWSYDLCSEAERTLWARLSVFSGGFDLDGAEEVCSGAGIARDEVLGLISGLLNKSIVTRAAGTARPVAWYYMLMSICQYGARRLGDETRGYQTRHRDHYRDLAAEWQADIFGPRQADWYLRLRQEHGNLRAALDFCLDGPGCGPAGLEIAAPIWNFWFTGFPREGYHYLQRALAAAPEPTPLRGLGLWAGGYNAMFIGEAEQQARWLSECADLAERFDDDHLRARIGEVAGHALLYRDDQPAAIGRLLPALDGFRAVGDGLGEFDVLTLLSAASFFLGDPRADEFGRQAYDLAAAAGAESSKAYAMLAVGVVQWRDHDRVDDATRSFRDAIRLWQPLNGRNGIAFCVQALSWCAASSAPTVAAARLMGASRAVWRSTGAHASRSTPYSRLDDQAEERVRAAIGDAAFDRAFDLGAAYSFEQAVALALGAEPVNRQVARTGLSGRLTPREHEIAGLIGEGLSNREIAARLVISQRTAETHVERILGKLAFTSRLQVARWVTGHGDT